ncbi:hypothetical protein GCM10025857_29290 [Alicyclobacillus contaminans]|uniref:hypothetical protein n=1 Tax=Alicyclobacillus contaminans TaxID=392016 RepID=UPI0004017E9B|nr:hypothetical protein [Alicyclobacillus contaminans]GMA51572.1 hypothetical protein GCM10025857_29290 [Alicyclobacillus contaminans]
MKSITRTISALALGASLTVPTVFSNGVVYADELHGNAHVNISGCATAKGASKADVEQFFQALHMKFAKGHAPENTTSHHAKASDTTKGKPAQAQQSAAVQAEWTQLQKALQQLHQDLTTEQAAKQALVKAGQAYVQVMKQALSSGNAALIQSANQEIQSVLSQLKQALSEQRAEDSAVQTSTTEGQKGDLTRAIQAIEAADARVKQKTAAIQSATTKLQTLTQSLEHQLSSTGSDSSGNTSSNTGATTSVDNTGNVTVQVSNG